MKSVQLTPAYQLVNIGVLAPDEGIYLSLKALLRPSNHVVVTYPGYQALYEVAQSIGCELSYWKPELDPHGSWSFDLDHLESLIRSDTKVSSPPGHNLSFT